jgi:hypothetical protein
MFLSIPPPPICYVTHDLFFFVSHECFLVYWHTSRLAGQRGTAHASFLQIVKMSFRSPVVASIIVLP